VDNGLLFSEWGWGAGILLSSSRDSEIASNLVAWNRDGISVISANRGEVRWNQVVNDDVHDNVIIGTDTDPKDPNHNNIYTLAFLQDWKGIMADPASNNHSENNQIYLPALIAADVLLLWPACPPSTPSTTPWRQSQPVYHAR